MVAQTLCLTSPKKKILGIVHGTGYCHNPFPGLRTSPQQPYTSPEYPSTPSTHPNFCLPMAPAPANSDTFPANSNDLLANSNVFPAGSSTSPSPPEPLEPSHTVPDT
ncbi:hypothetical protein H2248_012485, partial [Termitomyces sp. 'cryptogamus']